MAKPDYGLQLWLTAAAEKSTRELLGLAVFMDEKCGHSPPLKGLGAELR